MLVPTGLLGQGGMATVYKAYHLALDRDVAIKVLHPASYGDPTFTERFQREARLVAKLEHSNIVPVYDYAEHELQPYLVMKFIEGDTLKARLMHGPLSLDEITQIVDTVGSALAYAHKQGILHRDIKPSNVLIGVDGVMYLVDFGLARIAQSGESTLSSDLLIGTPQYISPEQAIGRKDLDERTDIYSFGVMIYEMVVGQVPFNADTPLAMIHDHIYSPLPPPHTVNPDVPAKVERVLLKALAKERKDRYENVTQLVSAFKDAWVNADAPMQDRSLITSHSPRPAEKASSTKVEAFEESARKKETTKAALAVERTVTAADRSVKKLRSLLYAGIGITLIFYLTFPLMSYFRRNLQSISASTDIPISTPTIIDSASTDIPISTPTLTDSASTDIPISTPTITDSASITNATATAQPPSTQVESQLPSEVLDLPERLNENLNNPPLPIP